MNEIKDLVAISKYAGERFDLVQAGGGNSSVKLNDGTMLIKASGFLLSDVEVDKGYSKVNTVKISEILENKLITDEHDKRKREELTASLVEEATIDHKNRPSIETLLHSKLYKYTLHTHPVVVNIIAVQKNWRNLTKKIFDIEVAAVEYQTPGIELAIVLNHELKKFSKIPAVIILQNHGLIVTSNDKADIIKLTEYVLKKIENFLHINMERYKYTNQITELVNSIEYKKSISYLSEDAFLQETLHKSKSIFFTEVFCPDKLVYCGVSVVELRSLDDMEGLINYRSKYYELPKVIIFQNQIFFVASNLKKAKEMEEVFKFHIMVLTQTGLDVDFLDLNELAYLSNWEAEKYRQNI